MCNLNCIIFWVTVNCQIRLSCEKDEMPGSGQYVCFALDLGQIALYSQNKTVLTPLPGSTGRHATTYKAPPPQICRTFLGKSSRLILNGHFPEQITNHNHQHALHPAISPWHFPGKLDLIETKSVCLFLYYKTLNIF